MVYRDRMLEELWGIRAALWEESGHDFHAMIQNITQEAQEIIRTYRQQPLMQDEHEVQTDEYSRQPQVSYT